MFRHPSPPSEPAGLRLPVAATSPLVLCGSLLFAGCSDEAVDLIFNGGLVPTANARDNPLVLVSQTLRSLWAISLAFQEAGIGRDTPDPGGGSRCGLRERLCGPRAKMGGACRPACSSARGRPDAVTHGPHTACDPRCAQPVVRFSIHENSSYIAIAIAPIVTRPAKASGMRCWLPAVCMR